MTELDRNSSHAVAPAWFVEACARPSATGHLQVAQGTISYQIWDPVDPVPEPPLLLIHGTSANRFWWTHIAGILADERRVVALDLSGHGESVHRDTYDLATWTDEVAAVISAVDVAGTGVHVVGHSLGGDVAAVAAQREDVPVRAIAMCETICDPRASHHPVMVPKPRPYFATYEEARARFRTIPTRANSAPYLLEHLSRHSIVREDLGWTWKHDISVASQLQPMVPRLDELVAQVRCPMAIVRAEHGLVSPDDVDQLRAAAGGPFEVVSIPNCGHHPMLDAPLALVEVLQSLTARWVAPGSRDGLRDI